MRFVALLFFVFLFQPFSVASVHTFGVISDVQYKTSELSYLRRSLLKSGIRNLVMAGDQIADYKYELDDIWLPFKKAGFRFDIVSLGNHAIDVPLEIEYFGMNGEYYSRVIGESLFIVLNPNNENEVINQMNFLGDTLEKARERFVFLIYHQPSYTLAGFHPWQEVALFQQALRPLLKKYQNRITAVINGHVHIASLLDMGGIPLLLSASTAGPVSNVSPVDYVDEGVRVKTKWKNRVADPYWTRLDINSDTKEVWLNFVNARHERVECSVEISKWRYLLRDNCKLTNPVK